MIQEYNSISEYSSLHTIIDTGTMVTPSKEYSLMNVELTDPRATCVCNTVSEYKRFFYHLIVHKHTHLVSNGDGYLSIHVSIAPSVLLYIHGR